MRGVEQFTGSASWKIPDPPPEAMLMVQGYSAHQWHHISIWSPLWRCCPESDNWSLINHLAQVAQWEN